MPRVGDPAAAERGLARWSRLPEPLAGVGPRVHARSIRSACSPAVFGNSPYLERGAARRARRPALAAARRAGCGLRAALIEPLGGGSRERRARSWRCCARASGGWRSWSRSPISPACWSLEQVTGALSRFADLAVQRALELALREAASAARSRSRTRRTRSPTRGIVVLGMGKLGALRAQLFERHRPDRAVRSRAPALSRPRRADGVRRAPDPHAGLPARAPHARRLRLPHRSAAAPASARPSAWRSRSRTPSSTTSATARTGSARR